MRHYLFEITDDDFACAGEEFIVGADSKEDAVRIATDLFAVVRYICELTEEEAEASGLDEY